MRVCIFARAVDGHTPGAYRWPFSILAERFADQGIECLVLTTAREDGVEEETIGPLIKVMYLAGTRPKKITSAYWRESAAEFASAHSHQRFDVIMGRGDTAYGALKAMGKKAPVLINHEGSFPPEIMRATLKQRSVDRLFTPVISMARAVMKRQRQHCVGHSEFVVCLTSALADAVSGSVWWRTTKTQVIPFGIDTRSYLPSPLAAEKVREKLQISSAAPMLLYVGRVTRSKGAEDGLTVLSSLRNNSAHMVYVGAVEPDYAAFLRESAEALELTDRLSIVGPKPVDELAPFYSAADLLLFASGHNEGLPKVIVEAMACATPVVAYNLPGLSDVITDQVDGCLVQPGSIDELVTRIDALLDDPDMRIRMGTAARDRIATDFTHRAIDAVWQDLLDRVSRSQSTEISE